MDSRQIGGVIDQIAVALRHTTSQSSSVLNSLFFLYGNVGSESQKRAVFRPDPLTGYLLHIEVDAIRYSDEHIAVGNPTALGHAYTDTVASWVDHGLED